MDLVTPGIGQIFWTTLIFLTLLVLLRIFAWKPVLATIKNRNQSIKEALEAADKAKEEMKALQADNEKILAEARKDRDRVLAEAKEMKDKIIKDARVQAEEEASKIVEKAKLNIESEKNAAVAEMKEQIVNLSVDIAEKLLKQKLGDDKEQKDLMESIMKDVKLN